MSTDASEFFNLIYQANEGKAVIAKLDSNRMPTIQKFFEWPEQRDELLAYCEENHKSDLYTCPTLYSGDRALKSMAKATSVVYGDADTFDVTQFRLPPSITVHTSAGHTHTYWILEDSSDPQLAEELAHGVSDAHPKATTGYDTGWARNKFLRVPGSYNNKPEYKTPYRSHFEVTGPVYTVAEFAAEYEPVESAVVLNKEIGEVPTYAEALDSIPSNATLQELLTRSFAKGTAGSEALWLLYKECFRLGATDEQTFAIAKGSHLNKFERDGRRNPDKMLWEDILRARVKQLDAEDDIEGDVEITVQPKAKPASIDFLTPEEKDHLPRTFINEYVDWARTKTDADPEYHVAAACTILSVVFSDYGHAVPQYGRLPLNLWFMVLGSTTRSRKSTARRLMLKTIRALQDEEVFNYDLGSQFTSEGLDNALLDRQFRSGLLHRDEIQSFMKEIDSKAYLSGIKGHLTELYDGEVSGKLRATGDNKRKPATNVSLILFTMGIQKQLAEYLTIEDFQSGFLTRFIYVEGKELERSEKTDYLAQQDLAEAKEGDPVFDRMIDRLLEAREFWNDFVDCSAPTVPVPATPEAWARLNYFISDILDASDSAEKSEVVAAASDRLYTSIIKVATLLAMSEMSNQVELGHMLAAIDRCSIWFVHMVNMAGQISASQWKRRMDKLEDFIISRGGQVSYKAAYSAFKSELMPKQFNEIVVALEEAGQAQVVQDTKTKTKYIMAVTA